MLIRMNTTAGVSFTIQMWAIPIYIWVSIVKTHIGLICVEYLSIHIKRRLTDVSQLGLINLKLFWNRFTESLRNKEILFNFQLQYFCVAELLRN